MQTHLELVLQTAATVTFVAAFVSFAIGIAAGVHDLSPAKTVVPIFAAIVLAFVVGPAIELYAGGMQRDRLAASTSALLLRDFDRIDTDHNGVIDKQELDAASTTLTWTSEEREKIDFAQQRFAEIGHITGSYIKHDTVIIPFADGGGMPMDSDSKMPVYGISQQDLQTYPTRVKEMQ